MYIVTTEQMIAAEKAADAAGLSYEQMMENAGHAVAEAIAAQFDTTDVTALILVGPGNNGGDGLVVARYLAQWGLRVAVYIWKRNIEDDTNYTLLDPTPVERIMSDDEDSQAKLSQLLDEAGIIVDALLGTGISRPIKGELAELLAQTRAAVEKARRRVDGPLVNPAFPFPEPSAGPMVVALDVPSGLNSDTGAVDPYTLPADMTVTLAAVKEGHILMPGPEVVGELVVGDIGITEAHYPAGIELEMVTPGQVAALLPERPPGAHKGTFGTALLAGGSLNYTGAMILAGEAACRIGTGLVTLSPCRCIHSIIATRLTEATYLPLPDEAGGLAPAAVSVLRQGFQRADALLVGPGLGQAEPTKQFLLELLKTKLPPLVLDADALNILAQQPEWWKLLPSGSILTPHPGEMARLMNSTVGEVQANRLDVAAKMASTWGQIVLLKGAHTIIAAPDGRMMVLPFANPALAKAGSGDVLAGAIVGLLAQGLRAFEAAIAGGYLHGLAGEIARLQLGPTAVIAGDLVNMLPPAIREVTG